MTCMKNYAVIQLNKATIIQLAKDQWPYMYTIQNVMYIIVYIHDMGQ